MSIQRHDKSNGVFASLIKYGLVVYTGIRSIDLVVGTMPDAIKMFALAVVCAIDLAFLMWDDYAAHKAKSGSQHTVGAVMIVVDLLGIGAALIADTATIVDPEGSRQLIVTVAMFGIPALVLANIAALSAINQLDPDRKSAEELSRHEREMAAARAAHEREAAIESQKTHLGLERLANDQRLRDLQDHYRRGLVPGAGKSSDNGHTAAMSTLAAAGEDRSGPK
jgi:hypothetical protein